MLNKKIFKIPFNLNHPSLAIEILALHTPLSKVLLKKCLSMGSVWCKQKSKLKRLKKHKEIIENQGLLLLYYDPSLLKIFEKKDVLLENLTCLKQEKEWGVWHKTPLFPTTASPWSDILSLEGLVSLKQNRQAFACHRLDKEVEGPVLMTYTKKMFRVFQEQFQTQAIEKYYEAICFIPSGFSVPLQGTWEFPLENKKSKTEFIFEGYITPNKGVFKLKLLTGRFHQLRRHLALAGLPIMGDPLYGKNNKNNEGLQLRCYELIFSIPSHVAITLPRLYWPTKDF